MEAVQTNFETAQEGGQSMDTAPDLKTNRSLIYRMAHRYQNRNKAMIHYDQHFPLSVLVFSKDNFGETGSGYGVCYVRRKEISVMPIERIPGTMFLVGGKVEYWQWVLHRSPEFHIPIESMRILDYAILLPLNLEVSSQEDNQTGNYYTVSPYTWNREGVVRY